jgi:D-alanyl-D-alanine carboxypeptidase
MPSTNLDAARSAALQQVLDATVKSGAPDAIAAVITPDGTWAGAAGTDGPGGRKATALDEFAIASVTKMFTATLVLRLAEEGRIDLDAPISSYLGTLKVEANGATVRQTLGMVGGFAEDAANAVDRIHADVTHAWTGAEVAKELGPTVAPGTIYRYSNNGYALLAFAVEHVTGLPFATAIRTEVLDPVAADRIVEQGKGRRTPEPWALPTSGHMGVYSPDQLGAGGALPCLSSATYSVGGASMASDAPSLAAWTWHVLAGDVVNQRSLGQMTLIGEGDYGLGMERLTGLGPGLALGHTGSKTGYGSIVAAFPEQGAVVVLFVNDPDFVVEPAVVQLLLASSSR